MGSPERGVRILRSAACSIGACQVDMSTGAYCCARSFGSASPKNTTLGLRMPPHLVHLRSTSCDCSAASADRTDLEARCNTEAGAGEALTVGFEASKERTYGGTTKSRMPADSSTSPSGRLGKPSGSFSLPVSPPGSSTSPSGRRNLPGAWCAQERRGLTPGYHAAGISGTQRPRQGAAPIWRCALFAMSIDGPHTSVRCQQLHS
jgi:hypothetical protein